LRGMASCHDAKIFVHQVNRAEVNIWVELSSGCIATSSWTFLL
jgi:hypothetical protein